MLSGSTPFKVVSAVRLVALTPIECCLFAAR